MFRFVTENTGEWTGIYYAVPEEYIVEIEDQNDPDFAGSGLLGDPPIFFEANREEPSFYPVTDLELLLTLFGALSHYQSANGSSMSPYGDSIHVGPSKMPWADYELDFKGY